MPALLLALLAHPATAPSIGARRGRTRVVALAALVIAVCGALALSGVSVANAASGSLHGTVTDSTTGEPVAAATVTLTVGESNPIVVPTDDAGAYMFDLSGLATTQALLDVRADGYVRQWYVGATSAADATPVDLGALTTADVALLPIPAEPASHPEPNPTVDDPSPVVGQVITADPGIDPMTAGLVTVSYAWYADGIAIDGVGTQASLTVPASALGAVLRVIITATFDDGALRSAGSADSDAVASGTLAGDAAPTVTGIFTVGQTLTAGWATSPAATYTYTWTRSGTPIDGATDPTYTLTAADRGEMVAVEMTAAAPGYDPLPVTASRPAAVAAGTLTVGVPSVSGVVRQGETLSLDPGTWGPEPVVLTYEWRRGTTVVGRAATYKVAVGDVGKTLTVVVHGIRDGYEPVTTQVATVPVVGLLTPVTPRIIGRAQVNQVVTVVTGTWAPRPVTLHYQWYLNDVAVGGQRSASYRLSPTAAGKKVSVRVTGSRSGYLTLAKSSTHTVVQPAAFVRAPVPRIVGAGAVGRTLRADASGWSPAGTVRYQWKVNGVGVPKATASTFRVRSADAGRHVTVVVTVSRQGYTTLSRSSARLYIAKPRPPAVKPAPVVTFPNCAALNAVYPNGVARVGVTADVESGVRRPFNGVPTFNTALYNANTARDRDKDGIACEK